MNKTVVLCLLIGSILCDDYNEDDPVECSKIISRKQWGARTPLDVDYSHFPLNYIIIHHTVTQLCTTQISCVQNIRNIQDYHMDELLYGDIGYNFIIGGDGNIYEGVGWHKVGAHTYGYNSRSIGIAFVGNYNRYSISDIQKEAVNNLLECGVKSGELTQNYTLLAARQVSATSSPGMKLYQDLQTWPHFSTIA